MRQRVFRLRRERFTELSKWLAGVEAFWNSSWILSKLMSPAKRKERDNEPRPKCRRPDGRRRRPGDDFRHFHSRDRCLVENGAEVPAFAARSGYLRFEPRIGGRLLETYDDESTFEFGRVKVWEPGQRAWSST